MQRNRYDVKDNDLIWESFMNKTNHKQISEFDKLLESDLVYLENFLVNEGLMDGVKGAFGKVKDFASQKLLKPVVDMIVSALAKDPTAAQKVASAAEQGPEGLAALAQAEGDPSVQQQIQAPAGAEMTGQQTAAESLAYQFQMNEMICEALVEERLITSQRSQIIQEKYYRNTINEMHKQLKQGEGCPWMPATVLVKENATKAAGEQIAAILKQQTGGRQPKIAAALKHTSKVFPAFQKFVDAQAVQQAAAAEPEAAGADAAGADAAGVDASGGGEPPQTTSEEPPTGDVSAPIDAPSPVAGGTGPSPDAIQGGQGILGKIWSFLKNNKGILTGAVAIGVLGLMMTNPATAAIALPAIKTGLAGAGMGFVKGAATTDGGVKDRLMGGLNTAGKTGAMAAGAGAIASGAGAAADMVGGSEVTPPVAGTEDEFVEPTRPDAEELAQMQADTVGSDPEASANDNLSIDPYSSEYDPEPEYSGDANTNAQTGQSTSPRDYSGSDATQKASRASMGYDPNDPRGVRAPRTAAPTPEWMKKLNPFKKS